MIANLLRRAGINRDVGTTLLSSGWTTLAGPLTLVLLTHFLSANDLGFYYAASNVLASLVLFELGLSSVLLQVTSHEWAHLHWSPEGLLTGDARAKSRIASLLRVSTVWYGAAAALVTVLIVPGGFLYFRRFFPPDTHVAWQIPWLWMALTSIGGMILMPVWAILQGCGLIAETALVRLRQGVLGNLGQWSVLALGGGLYAAPLLMTINLAYSCGWLARHKGEFLREMLKPATATQEVIDWRTEVWPFQWRIALSGLSSYVIFQTFIPALLAARGPAAVGQLGLSLGVMQAVSGIGMTWLVTKCTPFGVLIAQKNWEQLDREFFPTLWRSTAVVVLGTALVCILAAVLRHAGYTIGQRLMAPLPLGLLAAATVVNHVVGAEAIYLRVHKEEPFLVLSLLVAALMGVCNLLLAAPLGATGLMLGYFLVYLTVGLGGGTWIFMQKRKLWHQAAS